MKISDIARRADVGNDTVRHYVALGLLKPGRDPANGYQIFSSGDLSRLRFIRTARKLGFKLDDIQAIFADADNATSPCPRVKALVAERLRETRARIAELNALCQRMEQALDDWREMPDSVPSGSEVCHLIESRFQDE